MNNSIDLFSSAVTLSILSELEEKEDISKYLKAISDDNIKGKVREVVSAVFFGNEKNKQEILEEIHKSIQRETSRKEQILSVYLATLSLVAFAGHKKNEKSSIRAFHFSELLAFLFFGIDHKQWCENESLKEYVLDEESYLFDKKDFFEKIELHADEIFLNRKNDNATSLFALKDFIETTFEKQLYIHYQGTADALASLRSLHCKTISIENIFYS